MKKLFITALLAVSMSAFGGQKNITPSFFISNCKVETELVNDSVKISNIEKLENTNEVRFYNIDRLVLFNKHNNRVLVVNSNNNTIVLDTTENKVDINLQEGNYIVYSNVTVKSIFK